MTAIRHYFSITKRDWQKVRSAVPLYKPHTAICFAISLITRMVTGPVLQATFAVERRLERNEMLLSDTAHASRLSRLRLSLGRWLRGEQDSEHEELEPLEAANSGETGVSPSASASSTEMKAPPRNPPQS